jgi:hypothetical protein
MTNDRRLHGRADTIVTPLVLGVMDIRSAQLP